MATIAVAGGTGGLGKAIVRALVADGKKVVVLSRKASDNEQGAPVVQVDYADTASLEETLKSHQVGTVVSTLAVITTNEAELNLITAAEASPVTKRFIPSSWGIAYTEKHGKAFPPAGLKLEVLSKLKKSSLEWTRINNGYFLDYWGFPKVPSFLPPMTAVVDLSSNTAGIPGEGNTPVAFTHTSDIAQYASKALDLPQWKPESYVVGDKVTWNEFVQLAEKAKGVKFNVTHDSLETLRKGQITELPAQVPAYPFFPKEQLQGLFAIFGLWFDDGSFDLPTQPEEGSVDLNTKFPDIKPLTVKGLFQQLYSSS
ncbi:hypothetical protein A1O3_00977 [Capronia epimyces CBS 606.96]|uniref:NmrA-like domain-containing protein n=1 Tax=Capronia epimyces CBS 606.96 TaxID=1182542 RepID=W9YT54_9EURO|nr:uncharacterized protein A1O3_00977 [Capronia epimyces CBS 606.96]EXJ92426.1 hypothetical protein A1O3_00977 [Capronia epimyces CBS 606.96]